MDRQPDISTSPANRAADITPSDVAVLHRATRGLYVATSGNVVVTMAGDTLPITFISLAAGVVHPLCVKQVWSSGTTATGIRGLY